MPAIVTLMFIIYRSWQMGRGEFSIGGGHSIYKLNQVNARYIHAELDVGSYSQRADFTLKNCVFESILLTTVGTEQL